MDATSPRSGGFALTVSSETGVPDGTSLSLISSASMNRVWSFGSAPFLLSQPFGGNKYIDSVGFTIRAFVKFDTGNLPSASKAVEIIVASDMSDSAQYGRTALCIDYLGRLHWKRDARITLPPVEDVAPDGPFPDHTASPIVPMGFLISNPLTLNIYHMVEIAITHRMEAVCLNGILIFARCRLGAGGNTLRPDPRFGWNVAYSGGNVLTNSGSMGANKKVRFDDVAINDLYDDGHHQNGWPRSGRIFVVRPIADVSHDYSWAPGGPQSLWYGVLRGTLNDAGLINSIPDVPRSHPVTVPPTKPPPFWPALDNVPMHAPSSGDQGAPNMWTGLFSGTLKGYGMSLNQTNPYEDGVNCKFPGEVPDMHNGIWFPGERNLDASGNDPAAYMVTSGASDWRGQVGVGRLPSFAPSVFHPDTEFIMPRAGGQDKLVVNCADPPTSGIVLLAQAWIFMGAVIGPSRTANRPLPPAEAAVQNGLKTWMPDEQGEPGDMSIDVGGGAQFGFPDYGPTLAGTPPLAIKRTRSIGPQGLNAYTQTASFAVYGAGIIIEDMSAGGELLEKICEQLMAIV